jgi:pimeloyl-ACP methyl ester carboxylesterase
VDSQYQGYSRDMNLRLTAPFFLLAAFTLPGCIGMARTEVPIPGIETADADSRSDTLVIMLPGRGDRAATFIEQGFQREGQRHGFDTVAVDAHFGYYMKRSLLPRLHEDIVLPARAAGYEKIWLLGVSMGGFGSLLYASEYPDEVDGVILFAPHLGDAKLAQEIEATGGLANWSGENTGFEDFEIGVWTWLRDAASGNPGTPVILAYGESDRGAPVHAVLGGALKPSSVYTLEGGHKWNIWQLLWERIAADLKP